MGINAAIHPHARHNIPMFTSNTNARLMMYTSLFPTTGNIRTQTGVGEIQHCPASRTLVPSVDPSVRGLGRRRPAVEFLYVGHVLAGHVCAPVAGGRLHAVTLAAQTLDRLVVAAGVTAHRQAPHALCAQLVLATGAVCTDKPGRWSGTSHNHH